eukprot:CAMPEP_0195022328 /NCGR_PEP_ID=MMETSP0326_2-20130528/40195_1 /TAXON_ID=2866 ORGANISM="Crypthecodinium cohnii, Strain Seligo" /NCGR_SAMPLE_ID=MMETSP0326_2 /ASSEMBLY_ACC=CAM_ASM_000348 /LENGTH=41 /DNA_ID= /DNA_START= /DNA_END= /DNA_ORIENTATION=
MKQRPPQAEDTDDHKCHRQRVLGDCSLLLRFKAGTQVDQRR